MASVLCYATSLFRVFFPGPAADFHGFCGQGEAEHANSPPKLLTDHFQVPLPGALESADAFDWDDITSRKHFEWHSCFGNFKCAKLQVPMDWQGITLEKNQTVDIAVIKVEATVPVTDSTYGGAVVVNPGGPGGSGVWQVLTGGLHLRTIVSAGPDSKAGAAKNFDMISFDPRGINNTRPHISCFPNHLEAAAFKREQDAYGWLDTSDVSFDNIWAMKRAIADGCSRRAAEEGIGKHMSTAAVTRDIVEIFEQHGKWREEVAKRTVLKSSMQSNEKADVLRRTAHRPGQEMVQYWGFSYGTLLGNTIAAMFPTRIKRAVLDGVVDGDDYMAAQWKSNLQDVDRLLERLVNFCFEGGPKHCSLFDSTGPASISATIRQTMSKLKSSPVSVPGNGTRGPAIVTLNDLQKVFRQIVYVPIRGFTEVADMIHELSKGEGTLLAARKIAATSELVGITLSEKCEEDGPYSWACVKPLITAGEDLGGPAGVACSDGLPRTHETKNDFQAYAREVMNQSELVGASWATITEPCTAWHARPALRYNGNFTYKPAHPVLFIGNTVDPATPLRNAFKMAARSDGARVLHHDSEGHCTHAAPSMCTGRAIREYFQSGTLPQVNGDDEFAFCKPDRFPFDGWATEDNPALPKGETDKAMWNAWIGLNRAW